MTQPDLSDALYHHAFDEAAIGMTIRDADGRLLRANRAFAEMLGRSENDLAGTTVEEITHPHDRDADAIGREALAAGEIDTWHSEKRYMHANGGTVWAALHMSALRDDYGRLLYTTSQIQDITERKQAEDALRASEESYRTLVEHLPDTAVTIFDRDFRCTFAGGPVLELLGWERDEVEGKMLCELESDRQRLEFLEIQHGAALAGDRRVLPYHSVHAGRDLEIRTVPLRDDDGTVFASMSVTQDVSERRRSEEELRESRQRLQAILDFAPAVVYLKDRDGRYVLVNHLFEAVLERSFEEIVGHTDAELFPAEFAENQRRSDAAILASGTPMTHEESVEIAGATRTYVDVKFPIFDSDGHPTGVCGIATDMTARKEAENALRESEERHRAVVEALEEAVMLYTADGAVAAWNPSVERIFGVPGDVLDRRLDSLQIVAEDGSPLPDEARPGRTALRTGEPEHGVVAGIRWPHGGETWLSINAVPLRAAPDERPYAVAVSMADITERRRAEALKDEFFALVSHELRTPLTSITGYLEMLLEDCDRYGDPNARTFLEVVDRNASRLLRLVGDLLFVAQFEAGKLSLEHGSVRIDQLAAEAVESAALKALDDGVTLSVDAAELPPCSGDPHRLAQMLDNLISNAIKFTPAGGSVEVRASRRGDRAVLEVADTGIGIASNEQGRLFERFFRSSTATAEAIPGVGLGLSITKAIVDAHGGTIAVNSAENEGTTFTVELPLEPARELV